MKVASALLLALLLCIVRDAVADCYLVVEETKFVQLSRSSLVNRTRCIRSRNTCLSDFASLVPTTQPLQLCSGFNFEYWWSTSQQTTAHYNQCSGFRNTGSVVVLVIAILIVEHG